MSYPHIRFHILLNWSCRLAAPFAYPDTYRGCRQWQILYVTLYFVKYPLFLLYSYLSLQQSARQKIYPSYF